MGPDAPERRPLRAILLIGIAIVIIFAITVVLLVPLGTGDEVDRRVVGGHPLYGEPAPEIDLTAIDGGRVTLSSLQGRPVLVNFWASWCGPCRAEFPLMVEAYAAHADKGLEILGIVHDDSAEAAAAFAAEQAATWPILLDPDDVAWDAYRALAAPSSFFIDADGVVRAFTLGSFTEAGLAAQLGTILPEA